MKSIAGLMLLFTAIASLVVVIFASIPSPGWAIFWIALGGLTWIGAWVTGAHMGISKATSTDPVHVAISAAITEILDYLNKREQSKSG